MIQKERIQRLNNKPLGKGDFVIYWMQASQRAECNHALEYAITKANELNKPLLVFFGITDAYPAANERHYYFMLEGLRETQASLLKRGIRMVIQHESPELAVPKWSRKACVMVTDRGYLSLQRKWRQYVANKINCPLIQVESDVVVPVEQASNKEAYSAASLRPKINRLLKSYLVPARKMSLKNKSSNLTFESFDIQDTDKAILKLNIDRSVARVETYHGGTSQAKRHLRNFLRYKLGEYAQSKNDPNAETLSNMSPYLHFGQISPVYVALKVYDAEGEGKDAYLEELIVRRELAINFVYYNRKYAAFASLPGWVKGNLRTHAQDKRQYVYTLAQLENAQTHDPYWNAAQLEMMIIGKMHGYMRMYWGKKILEWTKSPKRAFKVATYLNDKYELDGRDPNGYAGVAWCFGKHDRPWSRRPIFGNVRYMNANGLKRKFDADAYVAKIDKIVNC
jgi:deoxyribodipyrimidine photo-lyase